MIKKNTHNIIETEPANIADDVIVKIVEIAHPRKMSIRNNIQLYENRLESTASDRRVSRRRINDHYQRIQNGLSNEVEWKRNIVLLKEQLKSIDDSEIKIKIEEQLKNVQKLRYVDSVSVVEDKIVVHTRLIFTDIRIESGSRTYKRRCIGAFKIVISGQSFKIYNELFSISYPHWTVGTDGTPCYGEHDTFFNSALREPNYFMLLEYIYAFLRSTDDSAGYTSSNDWIERRNRQYGRGHTTSLRKGNYVVVYEAYDQYDPEKHCNYAEIVRCNHGDIYLNFKEPFEFGHDMRGLVKEGHGYRVSSSCVHKVSKKEYDEESVTVEQAKNYNPIDEIDALPFGSTLEIAKNIL